MSARALAVELDAIGDTRALWDAWLEAARGFLGIDPASLPTDRAEAASALDAAGAGNWRVLLERFVEDHAPAYLRRDAATSSALRAFSESDVRIGVFTDAPDELARTVLAHLGATRRVDAVETGVGALERLLGILGPEAEIIRSRSVLLERA